MKTYKVQKELTVWYEIEVKAEDELDALEKGSELIDDGGGEEISWSGTTGQFWVSDENSENSINGDEYEIGEVILEQRRLKAKAAELSIPVEWVVELES